MNMASFYWHFVLIVIKELINHKAKVVLCFGVVSFLVLGLGLIHPKTFETNSIVYADQTNIIKPLLAGKAATSDIRDQARVVRDVIMSPRIINQAAEQAGLVDADMTPTEVEQISNRLRGSLNITNMGSSFVRITFSDSDAGRAFQILTSITDLFIQDMAESKRNESREAYQFIDRQVRSYKNQLQEAEDKLKEFRGSNLDGTEATVKARIAELRAQLEGMKLDIDDARTRASTLSAELAKESQFISPGANTDSTRERLLAAQQRLDLLLLSYTEDYPDVVALKQQIAELQQSMREAERQRRAGRGAGNAGEALINPLYEELRSKLAETSVELRSMERRYVAVNTLLEEEFERLQRVAAQQAEMSELTRDYNVTKSIYEDMLERKEQARLSMTLDIEGQGVTYKVQEAATFPLVPIGLRFLHFVIAGLVLGVMVPIGLVGLFVFVDPRVRFVEKLPEITQAPILGVVPHFTTPLAQRVLRSDMLILGGMLLFILISYAAVVVARVQGFI